MAKMRRLRSATTSSATGEMAIELDMRFLRGDCYHRIQRRIPRIGYQKKCRIKPGRAEQLACTRT
jgi:hypothetical protein